MSNAVNDFIKSEVHRLGGPKQDTCGRYLYKWPILNEILESFLSATDVEDDQDKLFNVLKELGSKLAETKNQHSLPLSEIESLKSIKEVSCEDKDHTIKSLFSRDSRAERALEPTWDSRLRLDAVNLNERRLTCRDLKSKVEEKLK